MITGFCFSFIKVSFLFTEVFFPNAYRFPLAIRKTV